MTQDVDEDAEIAAMAALKKLLDPLDDTTKERVLRWGAERFQLGIGVVKRKSADTNYRDRNEDNTNKYGTFAELFDAARPRSGSERGLVAGYWFQVVKGQATFSGNEVNSELKNLGHPLANVTVAMNGLKARTPAYVLQVEKSGKAAQARKKYKLTVEGVNRVKTMLAGQGTESEETDE